MNHLTNPMLGRTNRSNVAQIMLVILCLGVILLSIALPHGSAASGEIIVARPTGDTYVVSNAPTRNFGGSSHVDVDSQPSITSLLRFQVGGFGQDGVAAARLRLYVQDASGSAGLKVFTTTTDWNEAIVTWNTRPALGPQIAAVAPAPMPRGTWVEVDLGQAVLGDGVYSFALTTESTDRIGFRSSTQVQAPELVLTRRSDGASPAPTPTQPVPTSSQNGILWSADQETGDLSQWTADWGGGVFNTGTGTTSVTTAMAHSGSHALELTITGASGSIEGTRVFRWNEGIANVEGYYSAWFYFPQRFTPAMWWNVFQFKSKDNNDVSQSAWSVNVGNRASGEMYLYLWDAFTKRGFTQSVANMPEKQWVHLEAYYLRSTTTGGRITLWQDGVLLLDVPNVQTAYGDNVHWSVNNYTDDIMPSNVTIYVDDAVISTRQIGPAQFGANSNPVVRLPLITAGQG